MATHLHYALSEHVTGYSLFRIKEFDELTKDFSGHLNSFIKLVAHVNFNSLSESVENVQAISEGRVTGLLLDFLRQNVPAKDCTLGVNHSLLGENIQSFGLGFECICQEAVCEILRLIRFNYGRLMRSFVLQPGDSLGSSNVLKASSDASSLLGYKNIGATSVSERAPAKKAETRARLVVALSLARAILDVTQFLSATWICRSLELVDELDKSICKSTGSLRISYKLHFPELCQKGQQGLFSNLVISDFGFINLIADYTSRDSISKFLHTKPSLEEKAKVTSWFGGSDKAFDVLVAAARDSIGQELDVEDSRHLKAFAQHLLKLYETRETTYNLLASRIEALVPNMASLFNVALSLDSKSDQSSRRVGDRISSAILAARLISHAGRLDRLATMPSSRLLSLGASKAIFRRSGAVTAHSFGLISSACRRQSLLNSINPSGLTCLNHVHKSKRRPWYSRVKTISAGRLTADVIRRRAARLLAAKAALACRADCFRTHNPAPVALSSIDSTNKPDDSTSKLKRLSTAVDAGLYGKHLGQQVQHQLRIWTESNGVNFGRTQEQIKMQRLRRTKYRKAKRKAWRKRKLERAGLFKTKLQLAETSMSSLHKPENGISVLNEDSLSSLPSSESSPLHQISNLNKLLLTDFNQVSPSTSECRINERKVKTMKITKQKQKTRS